MRRTTAAVAALALATSVGGAVLTAPRASAENGAATAIEFGPDGVVTVVAEPQRRGGGDAEVVRPTG